MMRRSCLLGAALLLLTAGLSPGQEGETLQFPEVEGRSLRLETRVFPRDFAGEWNVALVAFQREHQEIINTWLPELEAMEGRYPNLAYYEFPVIRELGRLAQGFIDRGMRVAVREEKARRRTVTFYIDKAEFRESLEIPDERSVRVLLVARNGRVVWRTKGAFTEEKRRALEAELARVRAE
jgi:hypothetical protein